LQKIWGERNKVKGDAKDLIATRGAIEFDKGDKPNK
jgi:hypothetical protein